MLGRRFAPALFVVLLFVSLLVFYTAYDKATKTIVPAKLVKVLSFQDAANSLKELNKVFALEAIGLISLVFLVGPLSRRWPHVFGWCLPFRKPLGITGFAFALAHGIYSLIVFYQLDFNRMFFQNPKVLGLLAAFFALLVFSLMVVTSTKEAVVRLRYKKWKALQTFGYVGLLFALLHFFILENKPAVGLEVRPYGMLFFYLAAAALLLRLAFVFLKISPRNSFEEHVGGKKL